MDTEKLYFTIFNLYKELQIKTLPLDCHDIFTRRGYRLIKYSELSHQKRSACMKLSSDSCVIADTVYYNENKNEARIRFSMIHELGHIVLDTNDEDEADRFASHMLAPRIAIHKMPYKTADAIHHYFGLSYMASNRALSDYRKWFQNICDTTREPSPPELALQELLFPAEIAQVEPLSISDTADGQKRPAKLSKKAHRRRHELAERREFFEQVYRDFGNEQILAHVQYENLYGSDL